MWYKDPTGKLVYESMREVFIFDEKIVDKHTLFKKTPRPFMVHYHKRGDTCNQVCEVVE